MPHTDSEDKLLKKIETEISFTTFPKRFSWLIGFISAIIGLWVIGNQYNIPWYWIIIFILLFLLVTLAYSYIKARKLLCNVTYRISNHKALARLHEKQMKELSNLQNQVSFYQNFINVLVSTNSEEERLKLWLLSENIRRHFINE